MKCIIPLLAALIIACSSDAKKVRVTTASPRPLPVTSKVVTFVVDKNHPCDSITLADIAFSRFDKPVESTKETFLCKNTATATLVEVTVKINYFLTDGTKIHSRTVNIPCDIPSGETRQLSVTSFDRQKSYRYKGSRVPMRRESTPFDVRLTPVALTFMR